MSSTGTSKTAAVGMTMSGDVAVGGANTQSMSQLAAQYMPGSEPSPVAGIGCGTLLGIVAISILAADGGIGVVLLIVAIGIIVYTLSGSKESKAAWEQRVHMYEHGWVCTQCGRSWLV